MNSRHSLQHSFCSPKFNCYVGPSSRRWCDNIDHTFTFLCFLLIDRTSGSCFFVPLLPRIRKRTKIVTLKWIFTTTKSRLPEVVILRKCLGKPQIRLKLQHIKGVSWLLAGPKAKPPNRVNGRKFCKSLNRRVLEKQTKSNTLNKFSRCFLRVFRYLFGE